jgi:hypothetical protein
MMYHEKFTTAELENKAADIMRSFDFEKVLQHMITTDWQWYSPDGMRVPDIEDLRVQARSLLTRAIWEESPVTNVGTGGFMAYKLPWGLQLTFQISNSHS